MRYCVSLLAFGVATAVAGAVSLSAAQAVSSASGEWVVPRTPDGRPDLQGNWSSATLTPLERPRDQGPVLNDRLYEYACHEGNYALSNILSGARYQERLEAQNQN